MRGIGRRWSGPHVGGYFFLISPDGHTVEVLDTPENRGMINKAYYMLRVEG